jgi:hypothetical protein
MCPTSARSLPQRGHGLNIVSLLCHNAPIRIGRRGISLRNQRIRYVTPPFCTGARSDERGPISEIAIAFFDWYGWARVGAPAAAALGGGAVLRLPSFDIIWLLGISAIVPTIQPTCRVRLGPPPEAGRQLGGVRGGQDVPRAREAVAGGVPQIPRRGQY